MKNLFKSLKTVKWFEWLYLFASLIVVVTLGIIFHSSVITIISSVLGITALFFIAKGMWFGCVIEICQIFFYCTISWFNRYYGEIISAVLLSIPMYTISAISWFRNRVEGSAIVKVNNRLKLSETFLALFITMGLSVGIYYFLEFFNTANLLISTIAMSAGIFESYLGIRRCEYKFMLAFLLNIISFVLWLLVVLDGGLDYIPTMTNYVIYFIMNIYGLFNWIRMKKMQRERKQRSLERERLKMADSVIG